MDASCPVPSPNDTTGPSWPPSSASAESPAAAEAPSSLQRLKNAFAAMLLPRETPAAPSLSRGLAPTGESPADRAADACESNPRSIVEALLFVGRPDNAPMSPRELAAAMQGVSPSEVEAAIQDLNHRYETDGAPYAVVESSGGYKLDLLPEYDRIRDRFFGRVREARLSPAALEVLAVVAYHQPMTAAQVNELRGKPSGPILATLVRRQLLQMERPRKRGDAPNYCTSPRFLRWIGLESLAALPRSEELANM